MPDSFFIHVRSKCDIVQRLFRCWADVEDGGPTLKQYSILLYQLYQFSLPIHHVHNEKERAARGSTPNYRRYTDFNLNLTS